MWPLRVSGTWSNSPPPTWLPPPCPPGLAGKPPQDDPKLANAVSAEWGHVSWPLWHTQNSALLLHPQGQIRPPLHNWHPGHAEPKPGPALALELKHKASPRPSSLPALAEASCGGGGREGMRARATAPVAPFPQFPQNIGTKHSLHAANGVSWDETNGNTHSLIREHHMECLF